MFARALTLAALMATTTAPLPGQVEAGHLHQANLATEARRLYNSAASFATTLKR